MKMSVTLKKFGLQKAFDYLYKDPEKHIRTLFGWAEKYGGKMYPNQLAQVKDAIAGKGCHRKSRESFLRIYPTLDS